MGDLILSGTLNLAGKLNLLGRDGGKVKVDEKEVVVESQGTTANKQHGLAPVPVLIPSPPAPPLDPAPFVWIIKSFNQTVSANAKLILTQGICVQGSPGKAIWPGIVQPSNINKTIAINQVPINVVGDKCTMLPTGAPVLIEKSGQE